MSAGDERTAWPSSAYGGPPRPRVDPDAPVYRPAPEPPPSYADAGPYRPPAPRWPDAPITAPYPPPVASRAPRRWPLAVPLGLVVVLAGVAVYQAVRIDRLTDRVAAQEKVLVETQARDNARLDGLDGRAAELEKKLGSAFNPEAISSAALPSVLRVAAGDVSGTAFAVGRPAAGGRTNLLTNFHVVESVYDGGGRRVTLERDDKRYQATIVAVDRSADVAHLRADTKIPGLPTAKGDVRPGQQIVVVGAPLGLTDSVTTGVVSAVRDLPDSDGPVIQFDAPINPGNSGGPVINAAKQVVGIATAKARDAEGIGLAVPITTACDAFAVC